MTFKNKNIHRNIIITSIITAILITSGIGVVYANDNSEEHNDPTTTASGHDSVAFGYDTTASNTASAAFGWGTVAEGPESTAFGQFNRASGSHSTTFGAFNTASGDQSTVFGLVNIAQSQASVVLGQYNEISGTTNGWVATDPVFVIGDGIDADNRHNAVTVLKNGQVGIGTSNPSDELHVVGGSYIQQILQSTDSSAGLKFIPSSGDNWEIQALTSDSLIFYDRTDAAYRMLIDGSGNVGIGTTSPSVMLTVGPNPSSPLNANELLQVAKTGDAYMTIRDGTAKALLGTTSGLPFVGSQSNHDFTIRTNNGEKVRVTSDGNVGIGTNNPAEKLHVNGILRIDGARTIINGFDGVDNHWFKTNGAEPSSVFMMIHKDVGGNPDLVTIAPGNLLGLSVTADGNVGIGTTSPILKLDIRGDIVAENYYAYSSEKWKKDITPLYNTLDKITQIQGVTYNWKADEFPEMSFDKTATQIGFIAEELEMIYPELVYTTENGDKFIDYSKLTPILLDAIKEQQNILEDLKTVICPDHPKLSACQ